jgi:hypothetical protein
MLDQLISLVKHYGREAVVENKDIPNELNGPILAEATNTIGSGFQNILAGGGLQNILNLFKGGKDNNSTKSGIGGLLKNPIVSMMVGYFISKLVKKYNIAPSTAKSVSNRLIPNVLGSLAHKTTSNEPENDAFDFNDLLGSLTGGKLKTSESNPNGFNFQHLLDRFTGNANGDQQEIDQVSEEVTDGMLQHQEEQKEAGGFWNQVKSFFTGVS